MQYWTNNSECKITKQKFGVILSNVWDKAAIPTNVKSGSRATGISPLNPDIIPDIAFAPSTVTEIPFNNVCETTPSASGIPSN